MSDAEPDPEPADPHAECKWRSRKLIAAAVSAGIAVGAFIYSVQTAVLYPATATPVANMLGHLLIFLGALGGAYLGAQGAVDYRSQTHRRWRPPTEKEPAGTVDETPPDEESP